MRLESAYEQSCHRGYLHKNGGNHSKISTLGRDCWELCQVEVAEHKNGGNSTSKCEVAEPRILH